MSEVTQGGSAVNVAGSADATDVSAEVTQAVSTEQQSGGAGDAMSDSFKKRMQSDLVRLKKLNADLAAQLERERQAKLEAAGDLQSVNESLKKQLSEEREKVQNVALGVKDFVIEMTVKQLAIEYGCQDVETVMKFVNHDEIESDGVRVNADQVRHFMDEMRKKKPHLFNKQSISPRIGVPMTGTQAASSIATQTKTFDPKKATAKEIAEQILTQFGRKQ
jgi:hypothetical protein